MRSGSIDEDDDEETLSDMDGRDEAVERLTMQEQLSTPSLIIAPSLRRSESPASLYSADAVRAIVESGVAVRALCLEKVRLKELFHTLTTNSLHGSVQCRLSTACRQRACLTSGS